MGLLFPMGYGTKGLKLVEIKNKNQVFFVV
jgi:hypothetical protein